MSEIGYRAEARREWISYHIFPRSLPHDPILLEVVLPVVRDLWHRRRFLCFFFIRYGEGGLHIRLRFLCSPEDRKDIDSTLNLRAAEFFCRGGPLDSAARIIESPFEPETQRYGGAELLRHSFDFFCLTSAYVLQQIECNRGVAKSKLLALALRALIRQALGFAADENEMARFVAYAVNKEWQRYSPLEELADREFERHKEDYVQLLAEEIEWAMDSQARSRLRDTMLTDGALLLNHQIRSAGSPVRWRILSSQLHMTWNRMGIWNIEEVYLGRILWRAVQYVVNSSGDLRLALTEALHQSKIPGEDGFETMIPESLTQLARPAGQTP